MRMLLVAVFVLSLIITQPVNAQDKHPFQFEYKKTSCAGNMLNVPVMVKNAGDRHVRQAKAACVALDSKNQEIGRYTGYLVYAHQGGLKPGASRLRNFVIDTDCKRVKSVSVIVQKVEYR